MFRASIIATDDVAARAIAEIEFDSKPTYIVPSIVRRIRVVAAKREAGTDGHLLREMHCLGQLPRLRRRGKRPVKHAPLIWPHDRPHASEYF